MPLRYTFRQLEYFVAVGEAGSIAKAASIVNVSPPSISSSIAQLEAEFGIQLFVRKHSHGLALTAGGRSFYRAATHLLIEAENLRDLAGDIADKVTGSLAIGCLATFAQIILPELRKSYEVKYPDVRIHQYERDQGRLLDMILSADLDCALTYDLELSQDTSFEPLITLPPYALLAADHRLAGRETVSPQELANEPMVLLDLPLSREYFLSLFHHQGLRPNVAERTGNLAVMFSMVANGFGYGVANMRPALSISPDGKPMSFVPIEGTHRPLSLGVVTPSGANVTRKVQSFSDHCREFIRSHGIFQKV